MDTESARAVMESMQEGSVTESEGVLASNELQPLEEKVRCGGAGVEVVSQEPSSAFDEERGEDATTNSVAEASDWVDHGAALEFVSSEPSTSVGMEGEGGKSAALEIEVRDSAMEVVPPDPSPPVGEEGDVVSIIQEENSMAKINTSLLVGEDMDTETANLSSFVTTGEVPQENKEISTRNDPPSQVFSVSGLEQDEEKIEEGQQEMLGGGAADEEGNWVAGPRRESEETNVVAVLPEKDQGKSDSFADIVVTKETAGNKEIASLAGFTESFHQDEGLGETARESGGQSEEKEPSQELPVSEEATDGRNGEAREEVDIEVHAGEEAKDGTDLDAGEEAMDGTNGEARAVDVKVHVAEEAKGGMDLHVSEEGIDETTGEAREVEAEVQAGEEGKDGSELHAGQEVIDGNGEAREEVDVRVHVGEEVKDGMELHVEEEAIDGRNGEAREQVDFKLHDGEEVKDGMELLGEVDGQGTQEADIDSGDGEEEERKTDAAEREAADVVVAEVDAETGKGEMLEEEGKNDGVDGENVNMLDTLPRSEEMDVVSGEVSDKGVSANVAHFAGDTEMVDVEKKVLEAGKEGVSESAEEVETNARNEADMENEGNEISGAEEAEDTVDTEEKVAEIDESKTSEVAEETEVRTGDKGQKEEDDDMAYETEDMETHGDSSMADVSDTQEETITGDQEDEEPEEADEENQNLGGKRKRGRTPKAMTKGSTKKKEEDVCFICFDGGDLVLCDRRGCPKAYHPSCVGRDEAFFRSKGKWTCGWHLCSKCEKTATYLCYTCMFSLCKGCMKESVFFCIRGNKGLCETCMETVRLIESKEQEPKEPAQLDFDDKGSWEYLFKDYWVDLKARLELSVEELDQAKSPWKGHAANVTDGGSASESLPKKKKTRRQSKSGSSANVEWASKELLDVVVHMRHGDKSLLPQSEVHNLLLEYIKRYHLRDPRRKSQVICDSRLQNLFGKSHVGHFEMLNLLDSHFLIKEESRGDDVQSVVVDTEANHVDADESVEYQTTKSVKEKKRKTRRKGNNRGRQSNLEDYAAIDTHNINLIYLRRSFVEDLLEDSASFQEKVIGAFVRLRITGNQKQDLYRLVQVVGTSNAAEPYKVGKRTTELVLEILNLDKTEVIQIDIISNQDFTEDECKRLRQSIKCGFINRLTVGDIHEKAVALQEVRIKNLLEAEILRFSHLRDRASDMGHRKELRECVEKLQVLKSPEERERRLEEIPEIHDDPSMDPEFESEDEDEKEEKKKDDRYLRPRSSSFNRRAREPISPQRGGYGSNDSWGSNRNYSSGSRELTRNLSGRSFSSSRGDYLGGSDDRVKENLWSSSRDREMQQSVISEKPRSVSMSESVSRSSRPVVASELSPRVVTEISPTPVSGVVSEAAPQVNESEKMWHYKDPSGKIQGPFSMVQLRKWNNTGYFPADLKIWKKMDSQDDSVLLADALSGRFPKQTQVSAYSGRVSSPSSKYVGIGLKSEPESASTARTVTASVEIPRKSQDSWGSGTSLPSPTPNQAVTPTAGKRRNFESRWSLTPVQLTGSSVSQADPVAPSSSSVPKLSPQLPDPANVSIGHLGSAAALPSPTPTSGKNGWGITLPEKSGSGGSAQIPAPGHPGDAPSSSQNSSPFFTPAQAQAQAQAGIQPSDTWRATVPVPVPVPSQPNTQAPPGPPNMPWGMNMMMSNSHSNAQTPVPSNHSSHWGGPVQPNLKWVPSVPPAASVHGWGGPNQGQPQVMYPNPGWGMTAQPQARPQPQPQHPPGNGGSGWMQPGQGPVPSNNNPNWGLHNQTPIPSGVAPSGSHQAAFWGNKPNPNGGGGDSGYGWNRQSASSFVSSTGANYKGQKICKFFRENGYCRKGASCDYIHN